MRFATWGWVGALVLFACDEAVKDGDDTLREDTLVLLDTAPLDDTESSDTLAPDTAEADTLVRDTWVDTRDTAIADTTHEVVDTAPDATADTAPDTVPDTVADTSGDTSTTDTNVETDTGPTAPPVDNGLNETWIGGACASPADCSHAAFNEAKLCQTDGFPNGFCTQACRQNAGSGAWVCPDADTAQATPYTTTRCISANGTPRCAAECDFGKDVTGCRPGYTCVLRSRHGQPDKVFPVCLPEPIQRWPGEPALVDDIGKACNVPSDCASRSCMGLPGGYCTKMHCDLAGCPDTATCFGFSGGESMCLRDCGEDSECREGEGYECDGDGSCWPKQRPIGWDSTVGQADCASAWGNAGSGLSTCDTTRDNYVVLRKSARNLALCKNGTLVANYRMGLGFAPLGDKQVEGDGKTPEGVFYVASLLPDSDYYKAFLISYPDKADAQRGLTAGIITQAQKNAIDTAQTQCATPPQTTALGGYVEIHGMGGDSDWTLGCAALDNIAVDALWAKLKVRDTIVILP